MLNTYVDSYQTTMYWLASVEDTDSFFKLMNPERGARHPVAVQRPKDRGHATRVSEGLAGYRGIA